MATASMVFWRLLCLPAGEAVQNRVAVLEAIVERARAHEFGESGIAWDGLEAVDRTPLVGGVAVLACDFGEVPGALFGPSRGLPRSQRPTRFSRCLMRKMTLSILFGVRTPYSPRQLIG